MACKQVSSSRSRLTGLGLHTHESIITPTCGSLDGNLSWVPSLKSSGSHPVPPITVHPVSLLTDAGCPSSVGQTRTRRAFTKCLAQAVNLSNSHILNTPRLSARHGHQTDSESLL